MSIFLARKEAFLFVRPTLFLYFSLFRNWIFNMFSKRLCWERNHVGTLKQRARQLICIYYVQETNGSWPFLVKAKKLSQCFQGHVKAWMFNYYFYFICSRETHRQVVSYSFLKSDYLSLFLYLNTLEEYTVAALRCAAVLSEHSRKSLNVVLTVFLTQGTWKRQARR